MPSATVYDLPPELIQDVYFRLSVKDLLKIYTTSKYLGSCIPEEKWRHVHLDLCGSPTSQREQERIVAKIINDMDGMTVINGNQLPSLCKSQVSKNILPAVRKITLSVSYFETLRTRYAFLRLLIRVLLPRYCKFVEKLQIRASTSERSQPAPIDELINLYPGAEKHVWIYAQGFSGLTNLILTHVPNVKQFGIFYDSSPRDVTYGLLDDHVGPYFPQSTETLVLCGDTMPIRHLQVPPNLKTLALLTIDNVQIPVTVSRLALQDIRQPLMNMNTMSDMNSTFSNLTEYEMTVDYGKQFFLEFTNLGKFTICFNPTPRRLNTISEADEFISTRQIRLCLRRNSGLHDFQCCGLSMRSFMFILEHTTSLDQLKRLVMVQTQEFFRQRLHIREVPLGDVFMHLPSLEVLILEGLTVDDFWYLQQTNGIGRIAESCPVLVSFYLTTGDSMAVQESSGLVHVDKHVIDDTSWVQLHHPSQCRFVYTPIQFT